MAGSPLQTLLADGPSVCKVSGVPAASKAFCTFGAGSFLLYFHSVAACPRPVSSVHSPLAGEVKVPGTLRWGAPAPVPDPLALCPGENLLFQLLLELPCG